MHKGRKIKTLLSSPIHLDHHRSTVEPLSLRCRSDIATLSLFFCSSVSPLSHRYCFAVATPLLLYFCVAVTPLLHRYRSTVALLLSLLLLLRSDTTITPLLLHCHSAAVSPAVAKRRIGIATLSRRYQTAVAPAQSGYK